MMAYWKKADIFLALAGLGFGGALFVRHLYPGTIESRLLLAVMEAALVGGLADWFAVTALFRKPLGFGWHTALIPRNRESVINGISTAVEKEFLSLDSLKNRLDRVSFVAMLVEWLENKEGRRVFRSAMEHVLRSVFAQMDPKTIAEVIEEFIKSRSGEWPLASQLRELLQWILQNHEEDKIINYILDELQAKAKKPAAREMILRYLRAYTEQDTQNFFQKLALKIGLATDSINLEDAADALQQETLKLLSQLREPDHPLRRWLTEGLVDIAGHMGSDSRWQHAIADWQTDFMQRAELTGVLTRLAELCLQRGQKHAFVWMLLQIDQYWDSVQADPKKLAWLEAYCKEMVFRILETEHHWIGTAAQDALSILTNRDLSAFVEDKAGEDLQWIRINGTVVGGIAGLLLFLFGNFIYDPFLLPAIQRWLP